MNPQAKLIFSMSLFLGTTITISSNHWMMAWTGLEINTLAILPLISKSHHPRSIEASTKYFLIQAINHYKGYQNQKQVGGQWYTDNPGTAEQLLQ